MFQHKHYKQKKKKKGTRNNLTSETKQFVTSMSLNKRKQIRGEKKEDKTENIQRLSKILT